MRRFGECTSPIWNAKIIIDVFLQILTLIRCLLCSGCDGVTYDNDCLAEGAGTSVCSQGACMATPCPAIYAPVCGCDSVTYDSECNANAAGTTVCSQGACMDPITPCPKIMAPVW